MYWFESTNSMSVVVAVRHGLRAAKMSGEQGFRGGVVALVLLACFVASTTAYPLCAKNLGTQMSKIDL